MEECEICGRPTDTLYVVELEGARVMVCESCSKGKALIGKIDLAHKGADRKEHYKLKSNKVEEEEVVDNYGTIIRKAREAMGLPLKVLAERINEKESTMLRVEEMKTLPSVTLTKKLEKELGIKLTSKETGEGAAVPMKKSGPITLGDAAFTKTKDHKKDEGE